MLEWLGLPVQASRHAAEADHVLGLEHWMMLVLFVIWSSYFVFVLFRFRSGAQPRASYDGMKSRWSMYLAFLVALAEGALLIGYEMPAWAQRTRERPSESEAVVVRVVAQQFAWNIHYPGPDRRFGRTDVSLVTADNPLGLDRADADAKDDIETINLLTLPVDTPVVIHLSSKDVVHSFGVAEMRVKQDATPGVVTPVWFVPSRIGDYQIACSQLCGLAHYRMRGFLNVRSRADFDAYLAEEARIQAR